MAAKKLPVIGTAMAAWADAFNAIAAMPLAAGIAFAIFTIISLLSFALLPAGYPQSQWMPAFTALLSIVEVLLLAPLAIIVHRYVLLGELTSTYPLDPSSTRYMRFVSFAILVRILGIIPGSIENFLPDPRQNFALAAAGALAVLLSSIVVAVVVVRRAILFPAIAIDAPGANWTNAGRDTKGSSWRVAFILVCAALPAVFVSIPLWYLRLRYEFSPANQLMLSIISAVVDIPTVCAFAAAASHIYRLRADALARSAA
jgi:hypothetical protein